MGILANLKNKAANWINKIKNQISDAIVDYKPAKQPDRIFKLSLMGQLLHPYLSNWYLRRKVGKAKRADVPLHISARLIAAAEWKRERKAYKRSVNNHRQQQMYYNSDTYHLA